MKRNWLTTVTLLIKIALLVMLCGCSPTTPRGDSGITSIPESDPPAQGVSLQLEERKAQKAYEAMALRLANHTNDSISFTGYGVTQPWYRIQRWIDGKWVDHRVGWFCGTGLRHCEIPVDNSSLIPVSVQKKFFPLRIGVKYAESAEGKEDQVVWSKRFDSR